MIHIKPTPRPLHGDVSAFDPKLADLTVEQIKKVLNKEMVYKLSFNENPLGPSQKAIHAMSEAAKSVHFYQDSAGVDLREGIAKVEGVTSGNIILSNGADELILMVTQAYLSPGDEAIIPSITFGTYAACTYLMDATSVFVPMTGDLKIDLDAIAKSITSNTKLIFLCNPNNPTGSIMTKEEIEAFLSKIPSHVLVVIDEAYHEYVTSKDYATSVPYAVDNSNVFVIRTFSKIFSLAGARVGYGIGNESVMKDLNRIRQPFNVSGISQAGALASLTDEEHKAASLLVNEKGKRMLYQAFDELKLPYLQTEGNFIYVNVGRDSQEVFEKLANDGVIVRTLRGYGLTNSLRVSIGSEEAVTACIHSLKQAL